MTTWMLKLSLALVLTGALLAPVVSAQQAPTTTELKKDIEALKAAIQKDLQEIKTLLQTRPAAPAAAAVAQNVVLDVGNNPSQGARTAKLTLVEFSDYQCPFCARHERETNPQLEKEYIQTGKLRRVFIDLPLESIHKLAFKAAEAARCAGDQGKYWQMHDQLFANQKTLDTWGAHAQAVGLDTAKFDSCLTSGKFASEVRKDLTLAQSLGITGTPGFFIAVTEPGSTTKVRTVRSIKGAQPYLAFKAQLDAVLAEVEAGGKKTP